MLVEDGVEVDESIANDKEIEFSRIPEIQYAYYNIPSTLAVGIMHAPVPKAELTLSFDGQKFIGTILNRARQETIARSSLRGSQDSKGLIYTSADMCLGGVPSNRSSMKTIG